MTDNERFTDVETWIECLDELIKNVHFLLNIDYKNNYLMPTPEHQKEVRWSEAWLNAILTAKELIEQNYSPTKIPSMLKDLKIDLDFPAAEEFIEALITEDYEALVD
ncbi:MAG: hypothetical protein F6K36_22810 [Symploca sp. SIO3C6]|nr:hypothetical protein [Symploca sp. SIO3C6]